VAIPQRSTRSNWGGGALEDDFSPRRWRYWDMTIWLVVVNVAVFIADLISGGVLSEWGAFSCTSAISGLQFWRFLSFQFLHADVFHLLFNMLSLYYFGRFVEARLQKRNMLVFYLLCGIAGPLMMLLLWRMQLLAVTASTQLVGASAGVFGVLVAAACISPKLTIRLLFPPVALYLRTVVIALLALAILTIVRDGWNAGGEAAHLGGAVAGFFLIRNVGVLDRVSRRKRHRFWKPGDPSTSFFRMPPP
jgi:membrane associated rhomboid family serine protease